MTRRARGSVSLWCAVLAALAAAQAACLPGFRRSTLPRSLTDEAFWNLSTSLSEPPGAFTHSDNLVSNELQFVNSVRVLPSARGAYIGVGPEQNFSYIAALRPGIAFVVDIRRENLALHLMYKALFELSGDRGDFLSRLFSRERPEGLGGRTSVRDLFAAYDRAAPSERLLAATGRAVRVQLIDVHRLALAAGDLDWIDYALRAFFTDGPDIHYARLHRTDTPGPSYRALMTAVDLAGAYRSYLASEAAFGFVKGMQETNLIVPVVGDFSGPVALREIGNYLRGHGAVVRAFYGSNVEVYLSRARMAPYCRNLAELPYVAGTWYLGNKDRRYFAAKLRSCGRPAGA